MILEVVFEAVSAVLPMELEQEPRQFDIQFDSEDDLQVDFGEINEIAAEDVPRYDGPHEVNPTFADQVLDTSGLLLEEDIKIESIPLARVSNNSGGMTVIIGG